MTDGSPAAGLLAQFSLRPGSELGLEALTHRSYAHEVKGAVDNQRLEFLGDSILGFLVSVELFARHPKAKEGELTRLRSQLVSTEALAAYARAHALGTTLRLGKGLMGQAGREGDNILADAVEALVAASYLESGLEAARAASLAIMEFGLRSSSGAGPDPKSELQERVQALGWKAPHYQLISQTGPAHELEFCVSVHLGELCLGEGIGRSKRAAEQAAASQALRPEQLSLIPRPSTPAPPSTEPRPPVSTSTSGSAGSRTSAPPKNSRSAAAKRAARHRNKSAKGGSSDTPGSD